MRLDPEIQIFVDKLQADWRRYPPLHSLSPADARAVAEEVRAPWAKGGPDMASTKEQVIETGAGPLRTRLYVPSQQTGPAPTLLYFHGGGFVMFSIDT